VKHQHPDFQQHQDDDGGERIDERLAELYPTGRVFYVFVEPAGGERDDQICHKDRAQRDDQPHQQGGGLRAGPEHRRGQSAEADARHSPDEEPRPLGLAPAADDQVAERRAHPGHRREDRG